jgi:soluble lytic murein transglycosylase
MSFGMISLPPRNTAPEQEPSANEASVPLTPAQRFQVQSFAGLALIAILLVTMLPTPKVRAAGLFALGDVPPPKVAVDPNALEAARALGAVQRHLDGDNLAAAERSLQRARASELLADYVALFEARVLLASGRADDAAEAARLGAKTHHGKPVATSFAELLGDALLTSGNEQDARGAWQLSYEATRSSDRRADLQARILASHERTGTLQAALIEPGDATAVADGSALPPSIMRELDAQPAPSELLRRADDQMSQGHSKLAVAAYDAALTAGLAGDEERRARLSRGRALFQIRRYSESTVALQSLLPEPEARFWHARSLARSGKPLNAIRAFEGIGAANDPKYGSWALYLAGTLLEDRGETARAMALYEQVAAHDESSRATDALWRIGWSAYGHGKYARSREVFVEMAARSEALSALRPRYWAARSSEQLGEKSRALVEFRELAATHPFSYYGWRASERLDVDPSLDPAFGSYRLVAGQSRILQAEVDRIELLLEADLADFAQEELGGIVGRVRSLEDRKSVGRLYVRTGDYHRAQRLVVDAYQESLSRGVQPGNETLWWLSWPPAFREIVADVFPDDAVIEPALVWAIMREESGYRPWITSAAGARGLLQIMPATGAQLAQKNGYPNFDPDDLYTPRVNIDLGTAYLNQLRRRFPGRLSAAIGSYNAGPRAVNGWLRGDQKHQDDDAWVEDIPYRQTRYYVKRVLRSLHVYRTVYTAKALHQPPTQQPANQSNDS